LDVFKYASDAVYDVFTGKKKSGAAMMDVMSKFMSAANPVNSPSWLQTMSPTIVDPFAQHYENMNYFGGKLAPEAPGYGPDKVMSYQSYKNAGPIGKTLAPLFNKISGGSKTERGVVDWSPNVWDNYFNFIAGGTGQFWAQSFALANDATGGKFDATKIPVVKTFYREGKPNAGDRSKIESIVRSSSVTDLKERDYENLTKLLSRQVESGEMDAKKAASKMKTVKRRQYIKKFADENDITYDEAVKALKEQ